MVEYPHPIGTPAEDPPGVGPAPDAIREPSSRLGVFAKLASIPPVVWLITGLWACLLVGASVLWPMSYGYDEPQHIDMAYVYSNHPLHFYAPGQLKPTLANIGLQQANPGYPPHESFATKAIPSRIHRPSFSQLGGHSSVAGAQPNQMVQHPPLYYWTEAAMLRLPGVSSLAWDVQVWLMRLLSVVLMLPLPLLCWGAARRLLAWPSGHQTANEAAFAVLASVIPLTVPNLVRDGASVNNDTLLILSTSVLLYLLVRVVTGDMGRRTAIGVALALAVSLYSKGFALVLPVGVLAAYLLGGWRPGDTLQRLVRHIGPSLVVCGVGGILGSLWWLRNVIDYGIVQTNGFGPGYDRVLYGPPDNRGSVSHFVPQYVTEFVSRIWGGIGLPDSPSPGPFVVYGWFVVVLLGVLIALVAKGRPGERRRAAGLAVTSLLTLILVAFGSWGEFKQWSDAVRSSQGRYVYHLFVVIAALAVVGWCRVLKPQFGKQLVVITLVGAIATNAIAWQDILRSWYAPWSGPGTRGLGSGLHSLLRWSPLPVGLTVLLVIALPAMASLSAITVAIWRLHPLAGVPQAAAIAGSEPSLSDEPPSLDLDAGTRVQS